MEQMKVVSYTIDEESKAKLEELANRHQRSFSGELRWLIQQAYAAETAPVNQPTAG